MLESRRIESGGRAFWEGGKNLPAAFSGVSAIDSLKAGALEATSLRRLCVLPPSHLEGACAWTAPLVCAWGRVGGRRFSPALGARRSIASRHVGAAHGWATAFAVAAGGGDLPASGGPWLIANARGYRACMGPRQ
eukprot:353850-Chlamydomonas_euryale.AAC.2